MSYLPHLQARFEAALQEYEMQTGVSLAKHSLTEQLRNCDSVDSITSVLQEVGAFSRFREGHRVTKAIQRIVSTLYKISTAVNQDQLGVVGPHSSPVIAIFAAIGILLFAAKDNSGTYDALIDILELMEAFLKRLDVYTTIPPTDAMTEMIVKILVELLATFALATKQIRQGRFKKFAKKLLGDKEIEAVLQRLDRHTQEGSRVTAAQTPEVLYGLLEDMRVLMKDNRVSMDNIRESVTMEINKSRRDKLMKDVQAWLSPADSWKNYNAACESHHGGTSEWFIQGAKFSKWKTSNSGSLLWVHGKPGAGKGILCSAIIQDIRGRQEPGFASMAFFYFDSMEDYKKDRRGLLSSLLVQLCHQNDSYLDILSSFYATHSNGVQYPRNDALVGCIKELLSVEGQGLVFLILDALDECSNIGLPSPRKEVLILLEELINPKFPHLYICVTSRPDEDIQKVLAPLASHSISLHDESEHKDDIDKYIKFFVKMDPMIQRWNVEDKDWVIETLSKQAGGSFRWVYSKLVYIRQFSGRTQGLLANLSATPNEMYHRMLGEILKADWELAHCIFQCVAVASRPLNVEELKEFFAIDFTAPTTPTFHEHRRQKAHAVLSKCSNLLSIVEVEGSSVVQFLHPSVQEYLRSPYLSEPSGTASLHYDFMTPARTRAAQACLGILLDLKDDITRDSLVKYPLAKFAAEHWVDHARFENVQQGVEEGLRRLFDPKESHFKVWIWIHDPIVPSWRRTERAERPSQPSGTPMHYAAHYGLPSIVKYLIDERSQVVQLQGFDDESTPLHVASSQGYVEVARILLDHGADATAQDKYGWTPLHKAAFAGHVTVARVLLDHGANAAARNKLGSSPLHQACRSGQVQVAFGLLRHGADATAQDKHGWTPLHEASSGGHTRLVFTLITYGADVRVQDRHGWTPYCGAYSGKHHELARMLLDFGADAKSEDKSLSLHEASVEGHVGFAHMLLKHGKDVNAQDEYGPTPLHKASEGGHVEVVFLLLEHGADATARDNLGLTPLHQACRGGHVEVARILLENGADAKAQDKLSWTSLHHSCARGYVKVARILFEYHVDVTVQDKLGWTPLHGASFGGHKEVCELLLANGAKATVQDKQERTPLHLASGNGHAEIARILLEKGANAKHQDKLGWTPLHKALSVGNEEVAFVLLDRGADIEDRDKAGRTPLDCASPTISAQRFSNPSPALLGAGHRRCTIQ